LVAPGSDHPQDFDRPGPDEARALIESCGLRFEPEFDDLVGLYEQGRLVACGARVGYVLKMLAITPDHQGGDALGELVTRLVSRGWPRGRTPCSCSPRPRTHPASRP